MAQRIITATQIRCHERNRKGPEYDYTVSELPEQRDLVDLLQIWVQALTTAPDRLRDEKRKKSWSSRSTGVTVSSRCVDRPAGSEMFAERWTSTPTE